MEKLTTNHIIQRKDDQLIISTLNEDLIMMDLQNGAYLSLNKTGRIIWELIENPIKVEAIIQHLTHRFGIDQSTCEKETLLFLENIRERQALKILE